LAVSASLWVKNPEIMTVVPLEIRLRKRKLVLVAPLENANHKNKQKLRHPLILKSI
jgi:hypothetical protein